MENMNIKFSLNNQHMLQVIFKERKIARKIAKARLEKIRFAQKNNIAVNI